MAQKVTVQLLCDLHDEQDVEADETVVFGVDGATYEIELCEDHARELRAAVKPFAAAARRSGARSTGPKAAPRRGPRSTRPAAPATTSTGAGRQSAIREWARAHGHTVSDRGRLSSKVTAAYNAAH